VPDYQSLGVAGLLVATLFIIATKLWEQHQQDLKCIEQQNKDYVKVLQELTQALVLLRAAIDELAKEKAK
jgi:hypothetical protein